MRLCKSLTASFAVFLILLLVQLPVFAYTDHIVLQQGMNGPDVRQLQSDLKQLGLFSADPTGFFGSITESAVVRFQKQQGLLTDGVAGQQTLERLTRSQQPLEPVLSPEPDNMARGGSVQSIIPLSGEIKKLSWFSEVDNLFERGEIATVLDIQTGHRFEIMRTYGTNHADVETLTAQDSALLKQEILGGDWSWSRRPVVVEVDGMRIAASMAVMPHAGRDDLPANDRVRKRSAGYGTGKNMDTVKGNKMDGVFDLHFAGSRTHHSNKVDPDHQSAILSAFESRQ